MEYLGVRMTRNRNQRGSFFGLVLFAISLAASAQSATDMNAEPSSPRVQAASPDPYEPSSYGSQKSLSPDPEAASAQRASVPPAAEVQRSDQSKAPRLSKTHAEEPPGIFQRFVQQTTGRLLPVYGQQLFDLPTGYAPVSQGPVPNDYIIGPGDEIRLQIWGSIEDELSLIVNRQGQINLPKVGVVNVAGVRAGDLESVLRGKISRIFTNFSLNATLGRLRSIQIYVVGQARQPGTYTVSSLSTLINALFEVGGPGNNGSMRNIQLKRGGRLIGELDLYNFIAHGDRSGDVPLQSGDVIVISPVGPRVAVLGAFGQPAIYELKGTDSIGDVLALGGGVPVLAKSGKALLERIDPASDKPRHVDSFALDQAGLRRTLRDGDILTLLDISPQFDNAVTLRGNVASPLRYPYTPGMRIRDLIPDREALITPDYYRRKNLLVQFEETGRKDNGVREQDEKPGKEADRSDKEGSKPGAESGKSEKEDKKSDKDEDKPVKAGASTVERGVRNLLDEVNWDYAVIERLDRASLTMRLIPFNLGRAIQDGDPQQNLALEPGDIVTILSKKDLRVPQDRQTRLVRLEGEVAAPGIYQIESGETLPQLLAREGGATRNAYLYGTEFTRESVRKQQQENLDTVIRKLESQLQAELGKQLANTQTQSDAKSQMFVTQQKQQLDRMKTFKSNGRVSLELPPADLTLTALPALPLEDGDAIYIPSRPGFVTVVGEVYNENAIIYRAGSTVGDALKTAGATDNADLDNAFVLRADGSVNAARDNSGLFSLGGFDNIQLMAGDTVVVPAKLDRETSWTKLVTGLKDWTQILYQLGLGAAAWKTLR